MCESCTAPVSDPRACEQPSSPWSRRMLFGTGLGAAVALTGVGGNATAHAASAMNAAWCNPALGYFPSGGHYGAPRGGSTHAGQDITNSTGTAVYAAAAGTVIRRAWGGGFPGRTGEAIVISHGNNVYTYYGHLSAYRVSLNAKVSAGQRIGDMGATGNVTGPHLHFETHTGRLNGITDPVPFMRNRGVDLGGGWSSIDPEARGATVTVIQHLMTQRGTSLVADGYYGPTSVNAVKAFQRSKGLVADGQVGPKTWPHLVYTLKSGVRDGSHVRALQTAMNKRSAGLAVDGNFGPVMNTAVRDYQRLNRLVVDGEAGAITWRALVG
ncbi:peptidoglycan DD-metalloendopeptidase family protein [Nocardiopsis alba]|uniref:peptidoglycan DD-metalloendopeptidase family protein n=1 Tax=Nocardiopsis alba TaxID=53437 RepID=UPI0033CC30E2